MTAPIVPRGDAHDPSTWLDDLPERSNPPAWRWALFLVVGSLLNVPLLLGVGNVALTYAGPRSYVVVIPLILIGPPALVTVVLARLLGLRGFSRLLAAFIAIAIVGVAAAVFTLMMLI